MTVDPEHDAMIEQIWRNYFTVGKSEQETRQRRVFVLLPGNPRCKICMAPFHGIGGPIARLVYGKRPSNLNPQLCNVCEDFARRYQGGAEVELSLLFVDVRGSTALAENTSPTEFSKLINRFYNTASHVLIKTDALIDKIIGDQVVGIYVPGFAGPQHAQRAIAAAQEIMRLTEHGNVDGPWIPLGAGVHTGVAFLGAVGSKDGTADITVLGDVANTAARLSTVARQGEILVSEDAARSAALDMGSAERRLLELKGKKGAVAVYVLPAHMPQPLA